MTDTENITLFIESPDGQRFECEVPRTTQLSKLAADFFEERSWPRNDARGRSQRAVLDLVDPELPDRTKRLRGEQTIEEAGLWRGAILRVFPESIAGIVSEDARRNTLTADFNEITALAEWNKHIKFEAEKIFNNYPSIYKVTLDYPSFTGLKEDGHSPVISTEHHCEIELGAGYPRDAPRVRWLTPIFHPNINPDNGMVCLGVLMDRYLPSLGLARLVTMLAEMVQWRNFDAINCFNTTAGAWAADPEHWEYIYHIGGSPFQGPIHDLLETLAAEMEGNPQPRINFKPLTRTQ
jgi:hypothetical protein